MNQSGESVPFGAAICFRPMSLDTGHSFLVDPHFLLIQVLVVLARLCFVRGTFVGLCSSYVPSCFFVEWIKIWVFSVKMNGTVIFGRLI